MGKQNKENQMLCFSNDGSTVPDKEQALCVLQLMIKGSTIYILAQASSKLNGQSLHTMSTTLSKHCSDPEEQDGVRLTLNLEVWYLVYSVEKHG